MEKEHLEILLEDIRGKFDLVLEGHEGLRKEIKDTRHELCEKINFVDFKVDALSHKVDGLEVETRANTVAIQGLTHKLDAVAADLSAHRADTEAHGPVYRVKE